jgi:3-phosphoshikimate 1-carboxyvinyltransferase
MIGSLAELGIGVASTDGRLPFTVEGTGRVPGGELVVDASASSQFVTALLLSAARFDDGLTLRHRGGPVPSLPHIDMTVRMLADSGVAVACDTTDRRHCVWRVDPGPIAARDRRIEPDLSNATPFVALAIATGGTVVISDWPADSLQPAEPVVDVFGQLGADFAASPQGMTVTGTGRIRGIDRDLRDLGELIPTIAALCALADSPSQLRGIGHIAGHETNRLTALAADLSGLGADVTTDDDSLTIRPAPLHGGSWRTYHDHRMATCGAILGSVVADIRIENVTTTAKTFPAFPTAWRDAVATGEGGHATAEGGHATAEGGQ